MCSKRSPLAASIGDVTWRPATSSLLDRSYVKECGGPATAPCRSRSSVSRPLEPKLPRLGKPGRMARMETAVSGRTRRRGQPVADSIPQLAGEAVSNAGTPTVLVPVIVGCTPCHPNPNPLTPRNIFLSPDLTSSDAASFLEGYGLRDSAAADQHLQQLADDLTTRVALGNLAGMLLMRLPPHQTRIRPWSGSAAMSPRARRKACSLAGAA